MRTCSLLLLLVPGCDPGGAFSAFDYVPTQSDGAAEIEPDAAPLDGGAATDGASNDASAGGAPGLLHGTGGFPQTTGGSPHETGG